MLCYVDEDGCIRSEDGERKFCLHELSGLGSTCFIYYAHTDYTDRPDDHDYKVVAAFTSRAIADPVYDLVIRQIGWQGGLLKQGNQVDQRTVAATFRQIGRQLMRLDNGCV